MTHQGVKPEPLVQAEVTTVMSKTLAMVQDSKPAILQTGAVNSIWPNKTKEADAYDSEFGTSNDKQHGFWHGEVILEDHASAMAPVGALPGFLGHIYG